MKQLDHVGIAVKDIEAAQKLYSKMLQIEPFHREIIEKMHLDVLFYQVGQSKIELLCPTSEKSTIAKFIDKKGEGIHHMAYLVEDIYAEVERMKAAGFRPLSEEPYIGALNKLVIFFHPKDTGGTLVELCQKLKNDE